MLGTHQIYVEPNSIILKGTARNCLPNKQLDDLLNHKMTKSIIHVFSKRINLDIFDAREKNPNQKMVRPLWF
jgi:hypothetical protein